MYSIDYVLLKNYRQYRDQTIEFPKDTDKNFTLIIGANGSGKTNFLNAITWCLYGKEMHIGKKYIGLPILNMATFSNIKVNDTCPVIVEIQFSSDKDKIQFRRELFFKKEIDSDIPKIIKDNTQSYPDGSKLTINRLIKGEWIIFDIDPQYIVDRIIPENIESFFFFDGERLDDYFKGTTAEKIKEAVFRISQLELFDIVIDRLNKKTQTYLKDARVLSPQVKEIGEKLESKQHMFDEENGKLKELYDQRYQAEKYEQNYRNLLSQSDVSGIPELENERQILKDDVSGLTLKKESSNNEKFNFILNNTPKLIAYKAMAYTNSLIKTREESGDLPPEYKYTFLTSILNKNKCICGNDLSVNVKSKQIIEQLLNNYDQISIISTKIIKLNAGILSIIEEAKKFINIKNIYDSQIENYNQSILDKEKRIEHISKIIGNSDVEQIKLWESKIEEWSKVKENIIEKIGAKKTIIEDINKDINELTNDIKKELKREERHEKILKKINFCEESYKIAQNIKQNILNDLIIEIEKITNEQFLQLIWKKETYNNVKIDSEYNISVKHKSGLEGIGTLSAGERQVLALSFMAALNKVSGFELPLIIDTPLGRISSIPKKNIAQKLPNFLEKRQVTLLMTEEEFTSDVRNGLSSRIGKIYQLRFKETESGGLVEVVEFE